MPCGDAASVEIGTTLVAEFSIMLTHRSQGQSSGVKALMKMRIRKQGIQIWPRQKSRV